MPEEVPANSLGEVLGPPGISKSLGALCAWADASPMAFKANCKRIGFLLILSSEQVSALHSIVDPSLVPCYIIPAWVF